MGSSKSSVPVGRGRYGWPRTHDFLVNPREVINKKYLLHESIDEND